MTAGRRPKPTALKVLTGTVRKDRANPKEPAPPLLKLGTRPPAWLRDRLARRYWSELVAILAPSGWLAVTDTTWLAVIAQAFGAWRHWSDWLAEHGPTYATETPAGSVMYRPRPEVAYAKDAEAQLVAMLREGGLTPSARTRIVAHEPVKVDPAAEFLDGLG